MDKYDKHIQKIKSKIKQGLNEKDVILVEWASGKDLFKCPEGSDGCLTMIKKYHNSLNTGLIKDELLKELLDDIRIPELPGDIEIDNLIGFAEWQRKLDNVT